MQQGATTCTEDRIQHALERCLHGLSLSRRSTSWSAGLCLNCWSLQELVSRDPGHFLILLEQILQKTREVQEKGTYDLLAPLALLFYSTLLCTPHFPPDSDLLLKASRTYHRFLTWPVPYCSICQELLTFIDAELKAPGPSSPRIPQLISVHGPPHNLGVPLHTALMLHVYINTRRLKAMNTSRNSRRSSQGELSRGSGQGDPISWLVPLLRFAKGLVSEVAQLRQKPPQC
uniref:Phosphoinositide 3-kinase regulatory subunit 5 n=1 Tax=Capra hircus TaxID=9925 RepID=A0A8C2S7V6_CAPHI